MGGCCSISAQNQQKKKVLIAVLCINTVMFVIQFAAALFAGSTALLADSVDMLGDALTYGLSLFAVNRGEKWLAGAALFKASLIALFGMGVLAGVIYHIFYAEAIPYSSIMMIFGAIGLMANGTCFYLLTRHRNKDINMRSTWICARNDIIGNISVLIAGALVAIFHSRWPDTVVGFALALVMLHSSWGIFKETLKQSSKK